MRKSAYRSIADFGPKTMKDLEVNNPLSYCIGDTIDIPFSHGSGNAYIYGCNSFPCQAYMSSYCAEGWDGFCEYSSRNTNISYPNQLIPQYSGQTTLNTGQILIRNTAVKKYLKSMGPGCRMVSEPFDPMVPTSPMISYWVTDSCDTANSSCSTGCAASYTVRDTRGIDSDPVMNKLLGNPNIAFDVLLGIYKSMKLENRLGELTGTKLGMFFRALESKGFR